MIRIFFAEGILCEASLFLGIADFIALELLFLPDQTGYVFLPACYLLSAHAPAPC